MSECKRRIQSLQSNVKRWNKILWEETHVKYLLESDLSCLTQFKWCLVNGIGGERESGKWYSKDHYNKDMMEIYNDYMISSQK